MKNKPSEIKAQVPLEQMSLFGQKLAEALPKKLRVEWSLTGPTVPYIPPHKSVPEDSSIHTAWSEGIFVADEDSLDLGTIHGRFKCENQPFESEDERLVLSLLHIPSDRGCLKVP